MATTTDLYKLRALRSFIDFGHGTPVSIGKGTIFQRDEETALKFIEGHLVEQVFDGLEMMVKTAHDVGGIAFVTDNPEVIGLCEAYGVGHTSGSGKKRNGK